MIPDAHKLMMICPRCNARMTEKLEIAVSGDALSIEFICADANCGQAPIRRRFRLFLDERGTEPEATGYDALIPGAIQRRFRLFLAAEDHALVTRVLCLGSAKWELFLSRERGELIVGGLRYTTELDEFGVPTVNGEIREALRAVDEVDDEREADLKACVAVVTFYAARDVDRG